MPKRASLDKAQARRIALAAQGFGGSGRASVGTAAIRRLIDTLGAVQIDSVNVLVRSQYLPVFSRLGGYDRRLFERAVYGKPRRIFEYWGHEASFLPIDLYPSMRWRMELARDGIGVWRFMRHIGRERKDLLRRIRAAFQDRGPLSASDLADGKSTASWWGWTDTKRAVEFLHWSGEITPARRRSSFEREYDLTERVIPPGVLATRISREEALRELMDRAARACGIATEADLRDYFRLPAALARPAIAQLVEAGTLIPVTVREWKDQAYLHRDARVARRVEHSALLSPFDSLVWNRQRLHRLFDFHYRIEIYTPAHKRLHGYYVLPYLFGERLAARLDLKADRAASTLIVQAIHYETERDRRAVRARMNHDLRCLAQWLELERMKIVGS